MPRLYVGPCSAAEAGDALLSLDFHGGGVEDRAEEFAEGDLVLRRPVSGNSVIVGVDLEDGDFGGVFGLSIEDVSEGAGLSRLDGGGVFLNGSLSVGLFAGDDPETGDDSVHGVLLGVRCGVLSSRFQVLALWSQREYSKGRA